MPDNRLTARTTPTQPATAINVAGEYIGGAAFTVIAGPCSVEGRDMLLRTATAVRSSGARLLRGGAFKPRTSPYAFRGLGQAALDLLAETRETTGLPVVVRRPASTQLLLPGDSSPPPASASRRLPAGYSPG